MAFMALTAGHLGANLQIAWMNFGSILRLVIRDCFLIYSHFFALLRFSHIQLMCWKEFILCCPGGRKYVLTYYICVQSKPMGQPSTGSVNANWVFELALRDRSMQVRFCWKVFSKSWNLRNFATANSFHELYNFHHLWPNLQTCKNKCLEKRFWM